MGTTQLHLDTACDRDNLLRTCHAIHELEADLRWALPLFPGTSAESIRDRAVDAGIDRVDFDTLTGSYSSFTLTPE